MPLVSPDLPPPDALLCEECGYALNFLPAGSLCPECGSPAEPSIHGWGRTLSTFERQDATVRSWVVTTLHAMFRPDHFFRTLTTRTPHPLEAWFAWSHRAIGAVLFGASASVHAGWLWPAVGGVSITPPERAAVAATVTLLVLLICEPLTRLTAWLTELEGRYWGHRLPRQAVRRVLHYHTPHFHFALIAGLIVTVGWAGGVTRGDFDPAADASVYLYTLSGVVVAGVGWAFVVYVRAMGAIRYANV